MDAAFLMERKITVSSFIFTEATLGKNEEILATADAHWCRFFLPVSFFIFSAAIIVAGGLLQGNDLIVVGLAMMVVAGFLILGQMNIEIVCTNRRVIYKRGAYWCRTQELRLDKIESVYVYQPIAPGMLGYGTIYVSGTGGMLLTFKYVKNPLQAKVDFEDVIDSET